MNPLQILTLNIVNFLLVVVLIVFTLAILRLFRDLPKLSRPWVFMLISLLLFAVHYSAVIGDQLHLGDAQTNEIIFQTFGTAFLVCLGLSLHSFRKAWGNSK